MSVTQEATVIPQVRPSSEPIPIIWGEIRTNRLGRVPSISWYDGKARIDIPLLQKPAVPTTPRRILGKHLLIAFVITPTHSFSVQKY